MKEKPMTIEEWNKTTTLMPVIVNEGLLRIWYKRGLITDSEMEALDKDLVVKIVGYWSIMSRNLKAVSVK